MCECTHHALLCRPIYEKGTTSQRCDGEEGAADELGLDEQGKLEIQETAYPTAA